MQYRLTTWTCSMDTGMHAWTYSRDMDIGMKIDTDIDIDMETKNWKHL